MANNMFVLDDGTQELIITNNYGQEICKLHIRTGDIGIIDRYNDFLKDFDKIIEPISSVHLKTDGTSSFEDEWAIIKSIEKELIDRLNKIFDTEEVGLLFETRNAFSTIGGVFYVEKVIEMLGNIVANAISAEAEKTQKRVEKYTKDIHRKESMGR